MLLFTSNKNSKKSNFVRKSKRTLILSRIYNNSVEGFFFLFFFKYTHIASIKNILKFLFVIKLYNFRLFFIYFSSECKAI